MFLLRAVHVTLCCIGTGQNLVHSYLEKANGGGIEHGWSLCHPHPYDHAHWGGQAVDHHERDVRAQISRL